MEPSTADPVLPPGPGQPFSPARLREVAWVFLKLGCTAFGGPAAHVAMMQREVVQSRAWVSRQEFLDLYAATNFIPGPNSTELAIHLGFRRAGWKGLIAAGVCFIVPAMLIVSACAWAYVRYGALPAVESVFRAVVPVIIAIVAMAIVALGRTALGPPRSRPWLWMVASGAVVAAALGTPELLVLAGAGVAAMLPTLARPRTPDSPGPLAAFALAPPLIPGAAATAAALALAPTPPAIFLIFLKIGSVLFGSGYVLLAFLQRELVERLHWITPQQMLDAVAVGQFTPGPVFTTATFIGYVLSGVPGAGAATAGIFLPAFVFVALTAPLLPWLRRSRLAAAALDGVNAASLALMVIVVVQMARAAWTSWLPIAVTFACILLLARTKINSAWLVLAAAAMGAASTVAP